MKVTYNSIIIITLCCVFSFLHATVGPITPGQSLWEIVKREAETVDIIESKVCEIDSQFDIVESKIDAIPNDESFIELIASKVCEIDSQLDSIESKIDTIPNDESLIELITNKVCEIDSQLDIVESKIDDFDVMEQQIASKVCEIDSQLDSIESKIDTIPNDESLIEQIASKVCEIDSQLDIIESKIDASAVIEQLIESKVCKIDSQLDIIESKIDVSDVIEQHIESKVCEVDSQLDVIESVLDLPSCNPTGISTATTITESGFYCLTNAITGTITIAASDVVLDLNNYTVSNGITVNENMSHIVIQNGSVSAAGDAISIEAGSRDITILNVSVKNAIRGINFLNVTGGLIQNCEMTQNTTGLRLDNSCKISVKECIASCNEHAGFDLLSSTTNCFENCKALRTGKGNSVIFDNNVFGFISADGYGNIFERCIAHSTQALTTTDFNSLIAGFALRGSERCTKIIECEAANSMANTSGDTKPYGILLEAHLDQLQSVTGAFPFLQGGDVRSVAWSPSGSFVAIAGNGGLSGDDLQIYEFERATERFIRVAQAIDDGITQMGTVAWAPTGNYLVIGTSTGARLRILEFNPLRGTLTTIATTFSTGSVASASWSSDGRFIAIGGNSLSEGTGNELQIFEVRPETVDFIISKAGFFGLASGVNSVAWSPDGQFIAVGGGGLTEGSGDEFQVFKFDRMSSALISIGGALGSDGTVETVAWSSDQRFIAVGGDSLTGGSGDDFQVVRFDRVGSSYELTPVAGALGTAGVVRGVHWAANNHYIAVAGSSLTGGTGDQVQIIEFDSGLNTLTPISGIFSSGFMNTVNWSPDGGFIAAGSDDLEPLQAPIISAFTFPSKNIIHRNIMYCNSNENPTDARGVSISGPNVSNMITSNISYNNPDGYEFVTNVFDGLSSGIPTILQNISIAACMPPCITTNLIGEIQLIKAKMCDMQSKVDTILLAV